MNDLLELINTQYGLHVTLRDLILFGLSPLFIATFIAEAVYLARKGVFDKFIDLKESIMNFTLGGAYQIAEGVVNLVVLAGFLAWFETFQFMKIPVDGVLSALLLLVLVEFFYYWYHRSSHRIRWFWCAHVVHHSSENMNFSTAMRQSIMYPISGNFIFFLPVILIGFSAEAVFACYAVNLAYQYFIHTQQIPKLHPWIEYVFNTPSHHRAHHGVNAQYIDMNYGGIVIVYDRLFNTFVEEDVRDPVRYGIPNQIDTLNFLTINFHEWKDMLKQVRASDSVWQGLKFLWKPPEWNRSGD